MPYKNVDDYELDGPRTLAELAEDVAPRPYRYWLKTAELLAPGLFNCGSNADSGFEFVDGRLIMHGPLWRRRREIKRRRERLFERISDRIRDVLASPRYTVTGIGPAGAQLAVPRDRANQVAIDLEQNTLSTPDGGFVWRAINVRMTTPADKTPPPRCGVGNTPYTDDELVERVRLAIKKGEHKSARAASLAIADIIPGHGSPESKARRLADKTRKAIALGR